MKSNVPAKKDFFISTSLMYGRCYRFLSTKFFIGILNAGCLLPVIDRKTFKAS